MAIKISYCSDPLSQDFGLKTYTLIHIAGKTLNFYLAQLGLQDTECFRYGQKILPGEVVSEGDHIVCAPRYEGDVARTAAFIALAVAMTVAMPYVAGGVAEMGLGGSFATIGGTGLSLGGALSTVAAGTVLATGGSLLINALLPPEIPSADSIYNSPSYLWGGASDTSQEAIPVPVFFGRFKHGGNLIASRTESKSYQNTEVCVQDSIFLLFGLSANNLVEIEQVYLNNQEAQQYGADDISIYWRKSGVVSPIKAVTSSEPSGTQLFYDGGKSSPASENEELFPNIVIEHYVNQTIPNVEHRLEIQDQNTSTEKPAPFVTLMSFSLVSDITSSSTSFEVSAGENDATGYTSFPTTGYVLLGNEYIKYSSWNRSESVYTFTIDERGANQVNHTAGDVCSFFSIETTTQTSSAYTGNYGAGYDWHKTKYIQSNTWYVFTSSSNEIENIILELAYPGGLYRVKANGEYRYRWQTYEIKIEQLDNSLTVVADCLFTPPDNCGLITLDSTTGLPSSGDKVRPSEVANFVDLNLWTARKQSSAFLQEISLLDVINAPSAFVTHPSGTAITLDSDGYLHKGYYYRVSIRVHGQGCGSKDTDADDLLYFSTISPTDTDNGGRDIYTANIYRIKEINYDECLSYPYVNQLALAVQANAVVNGQIPTVTIVGKYACKFFLESYPGIDRYDISTWPEAYEYNGVTYGENPAFIALTMLWDKNWGLGIGNGDPSIFAQKVNIDKFIDLATYCLETGDLSPRYTFNGGFDTFTDGLSAVMAVLKTANAAIVFDGATIDLVWERPLQETDFVQVFDSSAVSNFQAYYINANDLATSVAGTFMDKDNFYEKSTIQWMYPDSNVKKSAMSVDLKGITSSDRALWFLQYKLKKTNILRRTFEFDVDTQGLRCSLGDGCYVQSMTFNWADKNNNIFGGRVVAFNQAALTITLDKNIPEPDNTAHIIIHTAQDNVVEKEIASFSSGETTTITLLTWDGLDNIEVGNNYIIGIADLLNVKCVVTDVSITNDISSHVKCVEYAPEMFDNMSLFTVNSIFNPEITRDGFTVRNLQYNPNTIDKKIFVSWDAPAVFAQEGCTYTLTGYAVYKKEGSTGFYYLGTVESGNNFTDDNVEYSTVYFYKVMPVFMLNGVKMTTPLTWCSYIDSNGDGHDDYGNDCLATGVKLYDVSPEFLDLPNVEEYITAPNATMPSNTDIMFFVTDPKNWLYKNNAQEGYNVWCRFNDTDDSNAWLGPANITTTSALSPGASTISVTDATGLTIPGLIVVSGKDLIFVESASSNVLTIGQTDTNRRFSVSYNHSSGATVFNAHKGFFPVVCFGFEENTELISPSNQLKVTNFYKSTFDETSHAVSNTQGTFNLNYMGYPDYAGRFPYMLVFGKSNVIATINNAFNNIISIKNNLDLIQSDWTIQLAYWDITGKETPVYGLFWGTTPWHKTTLQNDDKGRITFGISGLSPHSLSWFGINRVFFQFPLGSAGAANYGWTSYFAMI